jgi:hypothetical protein
MAQLRSQIQLLRCKVENGDRFFIPYQPLYKLMTRDKVLDALKECEGIHGYRLDEIVERIVKGGQRIFAILVLLKGEERLISRFIEYDHLQRSPLDVKLPFAKETLNFIIPEDTARDFYEKQWEFVAPIFSRKVVHRLFHDEIRLPFAKNKKIGEGGFGIIYEIEFNTDHQRIPPFSQDGVSYWYHHACNPLLKFYRKNYG